MGGSTVDNATPEQRLSELEAQFAAYKEDTTAKQRKFQEAVKNILERFGKKLDIIDSLSNSNNQLQTNLSNNQAVVNALNSKLGELIEENKKLTDGLSSVEKTNSELKEKIGVVDGRLLGLDSLRTNLNDQLQAQLQTNTNIHSVINNLNSKLGELTEKNAKLEAKQADSEYNLNDISTRLEKLEANYKKENNLSTEKEIAHKESSEALDAVVAAFNAWSARPTERLAAGFYYVEGDIKIRTTQEILSTNSVSKWIANSNGNKKYIFPNPNLFNQMTDISEIFELDSNLIKLAPIGENKIKIIKPCEISDNGFIRHRGAVKLI